MTPECPHSARVRPFLYAFLVIVPCLEIKLLSMRSRILAGQAGHAHVLCRNSDAFHKPLYALVFQGVSSEVFGHFVNHCQGNFPLDWLLLVTRNKKLSYS